MTEADAGRLQKRSMTIAGHRTSIALEPEFWNALAEICRQQHKSMPQLICAIDSTRRDRNLSSALRVYVLQHYRNMQPEPPPKAE